VPLREGGVSSGAPVPYWNAQNGASNLYWRNEGGRRFVEASKEVGLDVHGTRYSLALLWEDLDEDGKIDLYVVNDFGKNCLYRNEGGKFRDVAEEAGAAWPAAGMGVTCADADHDGNLDLFPDEHGLAGGCADRLAAALHAGSTRESRRLHRPRAREHAPPRR